MIKCKNPECGFENIDGSKFCSGCGAKLEFDLVCSNCGQKLAEGARFCSGCGTPVGMNVTGTNERSAQSVGNGATQAEALVEQADNMIFEDVKIRLLSGFNHLFDDYNAEEALRLYRKASDMGNALAKNQLALMYNIGFGELNVDKEKVFQLLKESAINGCAYAIRNMATLYKEGIRKAEIKALLQDLIKQGNHYATTTMGVIHNIDRDYTSAIEAFFNAAKAGNDIAMTNIGLMFEQGKGMPQDFDKAKEWYFKAIDSDNDTAMLRLGKMYLDGKGVTKDSPKAEKWILRSAQKGNTKAIFEYAKTFVHIHCKITVHRREGLWVSKGKSMLDWCLKGAKNGSLDVVMLNPYLYCDKCGMYHYHDYDDDDIDDIREISIIVHDLLLPYLNRDAKNGNINSICIAATYSDCEERCKIFEEAANNGSILAMVLLGRSCWSYDFDRSGIYVPDKKSVDWYERAIKCGSIQALYELGFVYQELYDYYYYGWHCDYYKKVIDKGRELIDRAEIAFKERRTSCII